MCGHSWQKIGECWVCIKCGITRLPNGQLYFDRKLPNYKPKKTKGKKHGKN